MGTNTAIFKSLFFHVRNCGDSLSRWRIWLNALQLTLNFFLKTASFPWSVTFSVFDPITHWIGDILASVSKVASSALSKNTNLQYGGAMNKFRSYLQQSQVDVKGNLVKIQDINIINIDLVYGIRQYLQFASNKNTLKFSSIKSKRAAISGHYRNFGFGDTCVVNQVSTIHGNPTKHIWIE